MKFLILILTVFALAILEKSLTGLPLVLPLVLAISFQASSQQSFLLAFACGLTVSLVGGLMLGRESLGLLAAAGLVHVYGRRFSSRHWLFFVVFAILGSLVYLLTAGRQILLWQVGVETALIVAFLFLIRWFAERFFSQTIVLKV